MAILQFVLLEIQSHLDLLHVQFFQSSVLPDTPNQLYVPLYHRLLQLHHRVFRLRFHTFHIPLHIQDVYVRQILPGTKMAALNLDVQYNLQKYDLLYDVLRSMVYSLQMRLPLLLQRQLTELPQAPVRKSLRLHRFHPMLYPLLSMLLQLPG